MKSFARALILSTALAATLPAMALEIKGAKFGDTYQVANQSLQLNGAGIRVKMVFDVYAAGLYVTKKDSNAAGLISQAGAKGMQIVLLRNLTGEEFAEAMIAGFEKNHSDAEMAKFKPRVDELLRFGQEGNHHPHEPRARLGSARAGGWRPKGPRHRG